MYKGRSFRDRGVERFFGHLNPCLQSPDSSNRVLQCNQLKTEGLWQPKVVNPKTLIKPGVIV